MKGNARAAQRKNGRSAAALFRGSKKSSRNPRANSVAPASQSSTTDVGQQPRQDSEPNGRLTLFVTEEVEFELEAPAVPHDE